MTTLFPIREKIEMRFPPPSDPTLIDTYCRPACTRRLALLVAAICWATVILPDRAVRAEQAEAANQSEDVGGNQMIAELIKGLASPSYATRIRCREQLSRIGLAAFDQLREAREHPDSEVAIVARQLTSGLQVQWSSSEDSANVRKLLSEYGSRGVLERKRRIDQLGNLPRTESMRALLRLARFEPNARLSRITVLAILRQETNDLSSMGFFPDPSGTPQDIQKRLDEANLIESRLGDQETVSNAWLRQYAFDLRQGRVQSQGWSNLLQQQRRSAIATDSSPGEMASDLLQLVWITAERAISDGVPEVAQELVSQNVELIPPRIDDLVKASSWALDHSLHHSVVEMHNTYRDRYEESPVLLYSAAEAYSQEGMNSVASSLAEQALAINPLPTSDDLANPENPGQAIHPQIVGVHAKAHVKIASELAHRGLFQWAEKEYELVIDRLPLDHTISAYARSQSATMYGELQDHAAVVRTLTPLAERISQDDEFDGRLIAANFTPAMVRSDLQFHRGLLMAKQGQLQQARKDLQEAFGIYKNIDILIAMYRLDGDEQWKQTVNDLLIQQIRLAEIDVDEATNSSQRIGPLRLSNHQVAKRLNAYAWLVSNTEGDYQKALRYSLLSLQKTPNQSALMDTAARCYFAVGDLESAVKMQAEACRKMPHSPPLQRQLEEFREALKSQLAKDANAPSPAQRADEAKNE